MNKYSLRKFAALSTCFFALGLSSAHAATVSTNVMVSPPQAKGQVWWNDMQAEPSVAVNPIDSSNILAGYGTFEQEPPCFFDTTLQRTRCKISGTASINGLSISTNGGKSWTQTVLPTAPQDNIVEEHADEIIMFGPLPQTDGSFKYVKQGKAAARAYYLSLGNVVGGSQPIWNVNIYYSDDKGATWSAPQVISVANGLNGSANEMGFIEDKPYMRVDTNPNSPNYGSVYIAYTNYAAPNAPGNATTFPAQQVMFQFSKDGGVTWSKRKIVANLPQNAQVGTFLNGSPFSQIATGPKGEIYVTYQSDTATFITVSTNGGKTFTQTTKVADNGIPQFPNYISFYTTYAGALPGAGARSYGSVSPVVNVHPVTGKVMVAYNLLSYDSNTNNVHGVLAYTTSSDQGSTWSAPQTLIDVPGMTVTQPSMAVDTMKTNGQNVFIGYQLVKEHALGTPQGANSALKTVGILSTDGGVTFGPQIQVSSVDSDASIGIRRNFDTGFMGDYVFSTFDKDGNIHYVWTDTRNGSYCQPYWNFVDAGRQPLPFDLYKQCPASNLGNTDIYWAKITP